MKPRLLHVFATFVPGGPQVRTARLLAALAGEYRHAIVAMDGRTEARELLGPEVEVTFLEPPARRGTAHALPHLRRLLRATRPDLLLTYNWGAIEAVLAGLLERASVLHHEDGFGADETRGFKRRRVLARRLLLRRVRGVVVPSDVLLGIASGPWRLPPERVHLVQNGVRSADFPARDGNPELRATLGIPPEAFVVGSVGHLRPEKNPVRLVEAFATLPPGARLVALGDGPERPAVERRARELGVLARVHLAGWQARPQPYYRAMDVFALSSDTEQSPVALLEAMASALPVVSTDVGDVASILPDEQRARLVALDGAGDPAARLGAALAATAADRAGALRLGAANRERVCASFSFERTVAAYRELYATALAPRVGRGAP